jgi:sulfide:quinone oxidoreductase
MDTRQLSPLFSASAQITAEDVPAIAESGFRTIINNRPDGESPDQPTSAELEAAATAAGLAYHHLPVVSGHIRGADVTIFSKILGETPAPVLAYCRTGMRAASLWALNEAGSQPTAEILQTAGAAGYDLSDMRSRLAANAPDTGTLKQRPGTRSFDVVIVGGGAAGIATAASLLNRSSKLSVAIIEPSETHDYQPGFTMVGGGVFTQQETRRSMQSVMPSKARWLKTSAKSFSPDQNEVMLEDGQTVSYRTLVLAPGLTLDWDGIPGLKDALGHDGVTSNYRYDLAPYTWSLVQNLNRGKALFTQPAMPIKCAGAPQKAMYLSCDAWKRRGVLGNINLQFHTVTPALFGVANYVPALMEYVRLYGIDLNFQSQLTAIDGPSRTATFTSKSADGSATDVTEAFDMLHVSPPQKAPAFIAASPFANAAGWVDVDQATLQQSKYPNVFSVGDACSAPNAKTAAAARKQAPIVAENVLAQMAGKSLPCRYDGYGSCPLTVERGKIVLAEFGFGGKLLPSFPAAIIDGKKPSRLAWLLKKDLLPFIYWNGMLKGREWMAHPKKGA